MARLGAVALVAVWHGHLALVVAFAGRGAGRRGALDGGQVVLGQLQADRPDRLGQSVAPGRAHQRDDVFATGQHPRDRELGDGGALFLGDRAGGVDEGEVVLESLCDKTSTPSPVGLLATSS
jgi:hypothetical protein